MADKAINVATNRQRDYITFLEQIIEVCLKFKGKIDSGYKRIFFRERDMGQEWHAACGEGWANSLFCCVYDSILSGTRILEISQSGHGPAEDTIKLHMHLNISPDRITDDKKESLARAKIGEVLARLQNGFVDSGITDRLKKDSDILFFTRRQLQTRKSVFHLKKSEIKEYLDQYYALMVDLVLFYDAFDQKQDRDIFIGELLRLDAVYDEKSATYQLDFWSPIALNKMQKVNDGIAVFFEQITESRAAESEWLQKIYKHILQVKAQHNFRWYFPGENQELLHAAIAPYVDYKSDSLKFEVIARSLKQYNSYEGIGELRLGEKIVYEYIAAGEKAGVPFCVAIMGDLHTNPVEELYHYVCKKLEKRCEDFELMFHIYTKNTVKQFENSHIIYRGCPDEVLLNREKLGDVIDNNNIVFILDCVELYKSLAAEKETPEFIQHKFAFSSYNEYNTGGKKPDICDQNMLEELYEVMTCDQIFNQFGKVSKQANDSLLDFCEARQRLRGMGVTIYVYVSDMEAFNSIYHDDQYYIRTERYNQKEIGIIRYSSEEVTKLAVTSQDSKVLVFSVWQFIKNVAIHEKDMLLSYISGEEDAYMDLDQIHIGIDYKKWPNLLVLHYSCVESRYEQVAVRFIKEILLPVLNNHGQDMFSHYIRKAMYSFFYSAAKSVNDMLFIHLFQNRKELLGKAVLAEKNDADTVKNNININFKYSSKRFYDMIMKNYDMSSNIYVGQIRTSHIIQKNERKGNKIRKNEIYQNVITACKNLSYDGGYLAKNCKLELKGRYSGGDI